MPRPAPSAQQRRQSLVRASAPLGADDGASPLDDLLHAAETTAQFHLRPLADAPGETAALPEAAPAETSWEEARPLVEQRVAVMKAELQDKRQRASRLAAENAIMRQKLAS